MSGGIRPLQSVGLLEDNVRLKLFGGSPSFDMTAARFMPKHTPPTPRSGAIDSFVVTNAPQLG